MERLRFVQGRASRARDTTASRWQPPPNASGFRSVPESQEKCVLRDSPHGQGGPSSRTFRFCIAVPVIGSAWIVDSGVVVGIAFNPLRVAPASEEE
jgi:hypothetical protein